MAEQQTWQWSSGSSLLAEHSQTNLYLACKRCMDVIGAAVLLVALVPLLVVIAVLIKLDTEGSILFRQERAGAKRTRIGAQTYWLTQNFTMYKFRSMVANADSSLHEAHIRDFVKGKIEVGAPQADGTFKLSNDPRITRIGRILRMSSLDELPQLLNVLKGDMSLVGPRPVPLYEVAYYESHHRRRLAAVPGITGLWQVKGRSLVPFAEMVRMDLEYIRNASLWLDLKILFLTIPAVLSRRGAK